MKGVQTMAESEVQPVHTSAKPGERMKKLGGLLVGLCFACLIIGRAIVTIFFPELQGQGIPPAMWFVLVPIWSLGIIGLVLLLVGWLRGKFAKSGSAAEPGDMSAFSGS